jgi:hypothetical protein
MKSSYITKYIQKIFLLTSSNTFVKPRLRRSLQPHLFIVALLFISISFISCEKDFNIKTDNNTPLLVVEAYINNQMREYNYVVLSRSLDYFSTDFQSVAVANATVTVTEGEIVNNQYVWNPATKIRLSEANLPAVPTNFRQGVYFDPRLATNPQTALIGTPGKSYLLEITEGGNQYSAITTLLQPVQIDSVTTGYKYVDSGITKLRITDHYKDPDTLNNTYFYYYRYKDNRNNFGWGGISKSRAYGADDLSNGQYIHLTFPRGYALRDTVNFYMASVTRDVYNFWDSYNKARDNNGPFATPVSLVSNIKGNNVTGCFTGLSLSSKTIIIKE